ncbi:hypothetical protein HGRIS_000001 [Hohenbuehelia grisea]|uniref:Uncharacterized protein n=1 Tax=Hohenbuehelia grisea TaxID=104357 RepID=A0ABR3JPS5_9AGAR
MNAHRRYDSPTNLTSISHLRLNPTSQRVSPAYRNRTKFPVCAPSIPVQPFEDGRTHTRLRFVVRLHTHFSGYFPYETTLMRPTDRLTHRSTPIYLSATHSLLQTLPRSIGVAAWQEILKKIAAQWGGVRNEAATADHQCIACASPGRPNHEHAAHSAATTTDSL